jgi:hypothetical protein
MHVDTHVRWTLPIAPVVDHADIAQRIVSVQPGGGGIYVDLALVNAYQALEARSSNLKHLLLFADGDDAEERERAFMLVQNARARNITTSVVALGQGKDVAALERMSQLGNGRFYLIQDASRLLAVFAQETILAARSALHEAPFRAQPGAPSAATRGIDFSMAPELGGYVVTIRKPRAEVLLHAVEGDPLLATWSIGLGRSAAFSSDYSFRWGAKWSTWDGAAQLFGQLAREIARRPEDPRVRLDASIDAGQLKVVLNAVDEDQRAESFRRFEAHVAGPGGFATRLALDPVAAGVYSARLPLPRPGAYVVSAIDQQSSQVAATTGAVLSRGQELVSTGTDRALLRKVAELSGGKLRDTLAGVFEDRPARRASYQDITALLFSIAAFSLLFGVSVRRLALPLDRPDGQGRLSTVPKRWLGLLAAAQPRTAQESVDEPVTQSTEPVPNASATPEPGLYPQSAAAILVARRRARTRR